MIHSIYNYCHNNFKNSIFNLIKSTTIRYDIATRVNSVLSTGIAKVSTDVQISGDKNV